MDVTSRNGARRKEHLIDVELNSGLGTATIMT